MSNNTITSDYRPPDPGRSASRQTTPHQPESFPPHGTNKDGAAASNSGSLKDNISNVPVSQHSQKPTIDTTNLDLLTRIEGMYRFLDVVSEQGTGGVVDKIVIDEAGVKAFVNKLHPGAYKTISSVDFTSLDASRLELVGVYGSKTEITRFLVESGHVDESIAALLNKPLSSQASLQSQPCLRSGLYILDADLGQVESRRTYVIFWPEDSTWKNNAASSTKRNRIAFMRYLTKLADQLLVFVSPEDAKSIIWQEATTTLDDWSIDEGDQDDGDENIFSSDRIFDFSVEKTAEQDEDVRTRPGFQVPHQSISLPMEVDEETSSALLRPRLVPGELAQAILTAVPQAASTVTQSFKDPYNEIALRRFILDARVVRIGPDVTDDGLEILARNGLADKAPDACRAWNEASAIAHTTFNDDRNKAATDIQERLDSGLEQLRNTIYPQLLNHIVQLYPPSLSARLIELFEPETQLPDAEDLWNTLCKRFPDCQSILDAQLRSNDFNIFRKNMAIKKRKTHLFAASEILAAHLDLDDEKKAAVLQQILDEGKQAPSLTDKGRWSALSKAWNWVSGADDARAELSAAVKAGGNLPDPDFLDLLQVMAGQPLFTEHAVALMTEVTHVIKDKANRAVKTIAHKISGIQQQTLSKRSSEVLTEKLGATLAELRGQFAQAVAAVPAPDGSTGPGVIFNSVVENRQSARWYSSVSSPPFHISGERTSETLPSIRYTLHPLSLTEDDKQGLRLNPTHIPTPILNSRFEHNFFLPVGQAIRHIQLVSKDKCFLAVTTNDLLMLYLEPCAQLDAATKNGHFKTKLHLERLGKDYVLTFDESKRAMAILAMINGDYNLHLYELDEQMGSIRGTAGNTINLTPWFADNPRIIHHICFVGSSDSQAAAEICFIDESNLVRIFSTATAQFRGATVTLTREPIIVGATPDGSCLCAVAVDSDGGEMILETVHWASFGEAAARQVPILMAQEVPAASSLMLTSFLERNNVHLLALDFKSSTCHSVALDITKKVTEYALKARGNARLAVDAAASGSANQLIECLSDVWTRFPVAPAISRSTITSGRAAARITFITDRDQERYNSHFISTVRSFEHTTRKPTGGRLASINVTAIPFSQVHQAALGPGELSVLHAGEWLIEAMCLIPIQIAVTRENRFLPLKDGVWSADLERSLLGASVNLVTSNLTVGWYESIFSYGPFVNRPVRVVSSMGEQSVGKSFSMNHLLDTSFAGSAMRCTEGVWMSCTPTPDALIVALDFEGVQSIERSAQEDSFLVLFNAAISNMILFRNNFALSRDIAGLFTSFQSASTILDPTLNPSLFQSRLVIIIKDVIENDRVDMVKEFQLKFAKIVTEEQAQNFITKAHKGQTTIIPWPVIESRQFYDLFLQLKKVLAKQKISHPTAGGFLLTLKTLMAKIKTHDWGALDQNLASQRIEQLQHLLVPAFVYGLGAPPPDDLPLKSFDDEVEVPHNDTADMFYFAGVSLQVGLAENPGDHQGKLEVLRQSARLQSHRQNMPDSEWLDLVSQHLRARLDRRLAHVAEWISVNTMRFANNAETLKLRRLFDASIIEVQAGIEFCRTSCGTCNLLCVLPKHHDGNHECKTNHRCKHHCEIVEADGHDDTELCGLPAGHSGTHLCEVAVHHCGQGCVSYGRPGCLKACSKNVNHEGDEHMCAGRHACGLPCDLNDIDVPGGGKFRCDGVCIQPWDNQHVQHVCEARMCPLRCTLCQRFCVGTHFHGQEVHAVHLCDQEHACKSLCAAKGVCEISTVPHAIETTFTGRHEVFNFTKYSQDARRLPCEIRILPGEIKHHGPHVHTTDPSVAHFCDQRCPMCDYLCTLPCGHAQKEHETSHGSMSKTRWVMDGADDAALEIDGHRFASNDSGAPMLCSAVCDALGRHAHIDFCRATSDAQCSGAEIEHLTKKIMPHPDLPKDAISHAAFWERTGFKDPYSRENRADFAKCDHVCCGEEHGASPGVPARPSYCTLPIFHTPHQQAAPSGGYVSGDGHSFACVNPAISTSAYHVIFLIDRSGSMTSRDRGPVSGTPVYNSIRNVANNRLGAVYAALFGFWTARAAAVAASGNNAQRRDSYSVVLFHHQAEIVLENDFNNTPEQLLNVLLRKGADGGTNFNGALQAGHNLMEKHWHTDQNPVIIFLSDGENDFTDQVMFSLGRRAIALGKPLAFHSVSFGNDGRASSLVRMVDIAQQVYNMAPRTTSSRPAGSQPQCTFSKALDSVKLTETFLGIAASLRKPRGALMRTGN